MLNSERREMEKLNHELDEEKRLKQTTKSQRANQLKQEYSQFILKQKVFIKCLIITLEIGRLR